MAPDINIMSFVMVVQIVVTDIDECIEALEENLANNLPAGCHLQPLQPAEKEAASRQTDGKSGCDSQQALQERQHITEQASVPGALGDEQLGTAGPADPIDSRRERDGWDIPQSVVDVAAQEIPIQPSPPMALVEAVSEGHGATSEPAQFPGGAKLEADADGQRLEGEQSAPSTGLASKSAAEQPGEAAEASVPSMQLSGSDVGQNEVQAKCVGDRGAGMAEMGRCTAEAPIAEDGSRCISEVSVATLDWRDETEFLSPPYDVLLVADVVRHAIFQALMHHAL